MLPFLAPLAFVVFVVLPAIVVSLWGRLWAAMSEASRRGSVAATFRRQAFRDELRHDLVSVVDARAALVSKRIGQRGRSLSMPPGR